MSGKRSVTAAAVVGVLVVLGGAACGKSKSSSSTNGMTTVEAYASPFRFEPRTINAKVGHPIRISVKNESKVEHNFSIRTLSISKDVAEGKTVNVTAFTATKPETLTFVCRYHESQGMTGTINVTP